MSGGKPGERLQYARMRRGWSGRELARRSGTPPSAVSKVEQGEQDSSKHFPAWARALEVSLPWLVIGDGQMTDSSHTASVGLPATGGAEEVEIYQYADPRFRLGPNAGDEAAPELDPIGFSRALFERRGIDPESCFALTAVEPVPAAGIAAGDDVLVDASETDPGRVGGRVFAFALGGENIHVRKTYPGMRGELRLVLAEREDGSRVEDVIAPDEREGLPVAGRVRYVGAHK